MIEEIIKETYSLKQSDKLYDLNKISSLAYLNYDKNIQDRNSFRLFEMEGTERLNYDDIKALFTFLEEIKWQVMYDKDLLTFGFVDNQSLIAQKDNKTIYQFVNGEFEEVPLRKKIENSNLYLQEEMHLAAGVLFFLWNLNDLESRYEDLAWYKQVLHLSGFFGQLASIYCTNKELKGTVFAGIIQDEWNSIVYDCQNVPIFSYAFTSK